jgi:hypothetical protein
VAYRYFVEVWYLFVKISQIGEAEVVAGINAEPGFVCCYAGFDERGYGVLRMCRIHIGIRLCE